MRRWTLLQWHLKSFSATGGPGADLLISRRRHQLRTRRLKGAMPSAARRRRQLLAAHLLRPIAFEVKRSPAKTKIIIPSRQKTIEYCSARSENAEKKYLKKNRNLPTLRDFRKIYQFFISKIITQSNLIWEF